MLLVSTVTASLAGEDSATMDRTSIIKLSLQQLLDLDVTTVTKTSQKLSESAAAIYVITNEDLRRSDATTLAEAMRLAPGMQVSRVNGHAWAISARGFADNVFANKLLVLMDGRTLYNPANAGVDWELQNTMLEDVERIEVIRGPGAALWGANAVNGVINIITKDAKNTQGGLFTVTGGTEEQGSAAVRFGGRINKALAIRGYAKFENRDDQALTNGHDAFDESKSGQAGFRMDWDSTRENVFTLQGDAYYGKVGNAGDIVRRRDTTFLKFMDDERISGANILGRWTHTFSETSSMQFQAYYDRLSQTDRGADEMRDTYDFDFQHNLSVGDRHEIVWGAGYRLVSDSFERGDFASYDPGHRVLNSGNAFAQDSITLVPEKLKMSLGTKLEFNDLSGFEYQPDVRLAWTPTSWQSAWVSGARAVRTPARLDQDVVANLPVAPPGALGPGSAGVVALLKGDSQFESEKLYALDAGYRVQPLKKVSIDLAGFYYTYKDIRSIEPGAAFSQTTPPRTVVPIKIDNQLDARSYGGEAVISGQATSWWRLQAQYSYLRRQYVNNTSLDPGTTNGETGRHPRNQAALRSFMNLPHHVELDLTLRFVDELKEIHVPAFLESDVRVGWRPAERFEISLVGQNLFDNRHPEWVSEFAVDRTEIQRSVYLKFTMKF